MKSCWKLKLNVYVYSRSIKMYRVEAEISKAMIDFSLPITCVHKENVTLLNILTLLGAQRANES